MSETLNRFVHRRIEMAEKIHDYIQLKFDDKSTLNIYNPFIIMSSKSNDLSALIGCHITEVKSDKAAMTFLFNNEMSIQISLKDSDYRGPEAMQYISADGNIIVWP